MEPIIVECGNITIRDEWEKGVWLHLFDDETGAEQDMALEPSELILIQECIGRWEDRKNAEMAKLAK